MEIVNLVIAFNLGLFSTLHCLGMCGGIIGALSAGIRQKEGGGGIERVKFSVAYNGGRIFSYTLAGAIAGFAGQQVVSGLMPASGHLVLQWLAAVILVLIGLHLTGWLPKLRWIESLGLSLWRHLQPLGRRFLPVTNLKRALVIGMIWGWLPCALVYSVLLWSLSGGSAWGGAALMFVFGLGTLPAMVTAGVMGSSFLDLMKPRAVRVWAGIIIILFGVASLFFHGAHDHHQGKDHHAHHAAVSQVYPPCRHPSGFVAPAFPDHHIAPT